VIDRFRLQGTASESFEPGKNRVHRNEMPLIETVTRFRSGNPLMPRAR
jgi:hypothetical protein